MNGRQPEEMENEMGQNIFVGILCVLALGACVWAWWISRGDSSENNNHLRGFSRSALPRHTYDNL